MGQDFDEITISGDGHELGSFSSNTADLGGGEFISGGTLICRDQLGRPAVRLAGGDDQAGGGTILVLGGAFHIRNLKDLFRVRILWGGDEAYPAGGTILLDTGDEPVSAIELGASSRAAVFRNVAGVEVLRLEAAGLGSSGRIHVHDGAGREAFEVDGHSAAVYVGAAGNEGDIRVRDGAGREVFQVDGQSAALYVGAEGNEGDIRVRDGTGNEVFKVDGQSASLYLKDRIALKGSDGSAWFKGLHEGFVVDRLHVSPGGGNIWVGGNGEDGDVVLFPAGAPHGEDTGVATIHASANDAHLRVGGNGMAGSIGIFGTDEGITGKNFAASRIWLDGDTGDIRLTAADCAEDFEVRADRGIGPGAVLVLDDEGILDACDTAYDKRVAGVVAGAGDFSPGIIFDRQSALPNRLPIALMGKTYCQADARGARIEVGDMLTTSATPGHAMKAADPSRAFGAIIGKALRRLDGGQGLIPILVALQ